MVERETVRGERGAITADPNRSYTLPSRFYHDADIYRRELDCIFHRSWCYLGHASRVPNPGDYFVDRIAEQSIFVLRSDASTLRAFFNVCQHRGHALLAGDGNCKKRIVCPYHAWSYRLDGSLANAPLTERLADFEPAAFGLKELPLAECHGLLFANPDPGAADFADEYAGFERTLGDNLPGLADFAAAWRLDFDIAANWKVVVDNFSEGYHIPVAHKRLAQVLDTTGGAESTVEPRFAFYKSRSRAGFPGFELEPGTPYLSWTLWPNTCMLAEPGCDNLIVLRMAPAGPLRCAERVEILSPGGEKSAPLEAIRALFAENFNLEDIAIVESVQQGLQSLGYDQGRYVADDSGRYYSEAGLHRFHRQVLAALGEAD